MRKTIKIFIASSIVEDEAIYDRLIIENFIYRLSNDFEEQYDIKIKPILCENLDDAYSTARKQEEYNEEIRKSELCFFIFFTKAGQYTQEEFEVSRKAFEESGKPKIYTYFKNIKDGEGEQSLYDFMKKLDEVFGHYYGSFDHVDTIKLRILLSLKLREMDFIEIKSEDGKCVVDGKAVMPLDNVAEFQNNSNLAALQNELKEIEQKYYEMKPIYAKGGCDDTFYDEYSKIASRKKYLVDEIEQLQSAIFNISMRMSTDETHGEVTPRQKEAYRLFELGDYDGCMAVLDAEEIDDEFEREERLDKERRVKRRTRYIREYKTKIDILSVMTNYKNRFSEIVSCYEKIVPYAFEEEIELSVVRDYIEYLRNQNNYKKAIKLGEKLNELTAWKDIKNEFKKATLYSLLGILYFKDSQSQIAIEYYLKTVEIIENLAKENPEKYSSDLAICYNNIGVFYKDPDDYKKAEYYYLKAIEINEALAHKNSEKTYPNLASNYGNLGVLWYNQGDYEKSEEYYLKAIKLLETLVEENPERYNSDLASAYNDIAVLYKDKDQYKKAEQYYFKSMKIREDIANENPERYNPDLASIYGNTGIFYDEQDNSDKAIEYYIKAAEIQKILAEGNPERYNLDLANSYSNVGFLYKLQNNYKKAIDYYLKEIEVYKFLAKENPQKFKMELAMSYDHAGALYKEQDDYENAKEYYLKSIEIREVLVKENPEKFNLNLARNYNAVGDLYASQNDYEKSEVYYLKAIEIYESLAKGNHRFFSKELARIYNNASIFYQKKGDAKKAEEYRAKSTETYKASKIN